MSEKGSFNRGEGSHGGGGGAGGGGAHKSRPGPDGDKPKIMKTKQIRAKNKDKVRVTLPPIESYQKELEFAADGPGRVIVRLERLMGSDRVRITDTKYMETLLERLEEQERESWAKRRFARIKTERNRFRQLAIDGLMEPGPDMQDLYHHPVFRVNRVLKRLAKMDASPVSAIKLPPIEPVDPFANDPNGRAFINYPGHSLISAEELSELNSIAELYEELEGRAPYGKTPEKGLSQVSQNHSVSKYTNLEEDESRASLQGKSKSKMGKRKPASNVSFSSAHDKKQIMKAHAHPSASESMESHMHIKSVHHYKNMREEDVDAMELPEMQQMYGISKKHDLKDEWEPFRSHLVQMVYHDDESKVRELYQMAEDVLGAYTREQLVADDFLIKLNKMH